MTKQYLTFKIADQCYGFPIEKVREINRIGSVTRVPSTEECYSGVMNVRGSIIAVLSLRIRMGLPEETATSSTCTIIVDCGQRKLAIVVDEVQSVVNIDSDQIEPSSLSQNGSGYIQEIAKYEGAIVMLVDIDRCFLYDSNLTDKEIASADDLDLGKAA